MRLGRRDDAGRRPADRSIAEEYDRLASSYDRRWSFYIRETLRATVERLDLAGCRRLLDLSCGTGSLFDLLGEAGASIPLVGLDLSAAMLSAARRKTGRAAYLIGAAQELPFEDGAFDRVVCCNSFHYYREPGRCLLEMRRVLQPGGRVLIVDWCDDYIACKVCDLCLRIFNRAHYRTYGVRKCDRLLKDAGFSQVRVERFKINWLWGLMAASGEG